MNADGLIDMGSMIIKPSTDEFTAIKDAYINTPYSETNGWGGSGVMQMWSRGFLTYYYEHSPTAPSTNILGRCVYANDMSTGCRTTPFEQVKIAKIGTENCPPAWNCDVTGEDHQLCIDYHSRWSQKRKDFESFHWHWQLTSFASRKGQYKVDSFEGYCATSGPEGYSKMLSRGDEPAFNFDGVPYISQEIYQDPVLVGRGSMDCGEGYVTPDCTCSTDPCEACPEGTRCQNEPGLPIMCIDCTCGFCDYDERPCCDFNGVNNCKAATYRNECKMQNGFFASFPGTGNVCSGVEITYTAVPNGCGCQPNHLTPCTYDPNDRSKADFCSLCSAMDLVPEDPAAPSIGSVTVSECSGCKVCLSSCPFDPKAKDPTPDCIAVAADVHELEDCFASLDSQCRTDCYDDCRKVL